MKFFCVVGLCASFACQAYPMDFVPAGATVEDRSVTEVTQTRQVDILFVVDNSGSMQDKQEQLRRNAANFINSFATTNLDYHLGLVTTDLFASTDNGRLRALVPADQPPYWAAPKPDDAAAPAARAAVIEGFEATVASLGTDGNLNEAGLGAALAALAPSDPAVAAHNAGFLRATADLAVVILTDEDDCSFTPDKRELVRTTFVTDPSCYQHPEVLYDPSTVVRLLAQLKGGALRRVRVGIIAGGVTNAAGHFTAQGCIVDAAGAPSAACGCWAPSSEPFFCGYDADDGGATCSLTATCPPPTCASLAGGACDTARCRSTPSRRYVQFFDTMVAQRRAAGLADGAYIASVCPNGLRGVIAINILKKETDIYY